MRFHRILTGILIMTLLAACAGFGGDITGYRKDRVTHSPNYENGSFKNLNPGADESEISFAMIWDFYFGGQESRVPLVTPEIVQSRFPLDNGSAKSLISFRQRINSLTLPESCLISSFGSFSQEIDSGFCPFNR